MKKRLELVTTHQLYAPGEEASIRVETYGSHVLMMVRDLSKNSTKVWVQLVLTRDEAYLVSRVIQTTCENLPTENLNE